jgi:hypothetical protein
LARSRTSRGAISNLTISRLCAITRLVASRISPRGAGTVRADGRELLPAIRGEQLAPGLVGLRPLVAEPDEARLVIREVSAHVVAHKKMLVRRQPDADARGVGKLRPTLAVALTHLVVHGCRTKLPGR